MQNRILNSQNYLSNILNKFTITGNYRILQFLKMRLASKFLKSVKNWLSYGDYKLIVAVTTCLYVRLRVMVLPNAARPGPARKPGRAAGPKCSPWQYKHCTLNCKLRCKSETSLKYQVRRRMCHVCNKCRVKNQNQRLL